MIMCAYDHASMCAHDRVTMLPCCKLLFSDSKIRLVMYFKAIAIDHHFNYTECGGGRPRFQVKPEKTRNDYKMIRDAHAWVKGPISSDLVYSFSLIWTII